MTLSTVRLVHEGTELQGRIAVPDGPGPHPGVLVMYDAQGLGPKILEVTQRVAKLGYVALATDMYGGGLYETNWEALGKVFAPLTAEPNRVRARTLSWYETLKARPEVDATRIAAIGYCFGGQCVLELARSGADVKTVVSFHGILKTGSPARKDAIKAQINVYTGTLDPYVPYTDVQTFRDEMTAANARWNVTEFGNAYHSFTDWTIGTQPERGLAYDALADRVSWRGMAEALEQAFGKKQ